MKKANKEQIEILSDWREEQGELMATFSLDSFDEVQSVVTQIMELAKTANHHPTVTFGYNKIVVKTVTHDAGHKITEKDEALARAISTVVKG
jgi:4a-hydroxytetrahydrobiopterin dehydratase